MIDRYLANGDMFALFDDDLKTVCVVVAIDRETCESKNIATYEKYQGKGYAKAMIKFVSDFYKNNYKTMLVGTGDVPSILSFYESCDLRNHMLSRIFSLIIMIIQCLKREYNLLTWFIWKKNYNCQQ